MVSEPLRRKKAGQERKAFKSGEEIKIKAKKLAKFVPEAALKDTVK